MKLPAPAKCSLAALAAATVVAPLLALSQQPPGAAGVPAASATGAPPSGADGAPALYYVETVIPDGPVFVGMSVPVELSFYFRGDQRFEVLQPPIFQGEGFSVAPLAEPERVGRYVGEVPYNIVIFRTTITPSSSGGVDVPPARIQGRIFHAGSDSGLAGLWRRFLRQLPWLGYDGGEDLEVATQARVLEVRPLPTKDQPENFSGLVGQFTMAASADPLVAAAGQPVVLRLVVQGRGNFAAMGPPDLVAPDGWRTELLEPVFQANDAVGLTGAKTFEFKLYATEDRSVTPAVSFSFFDPAAQKYVKLEAPPIAVKALGSGSAMESGDQGKPLTPEEERAADMRMPDIDRSGQLPQQRIPSKVDPSEKSRFGTGEKQKEQIAFRPEARLTMRDRIVRLLRALALKVNGVAESPSGLRLLLGPLILSEGVELPRLFAGQMERVKVQAIERDKDQPDMLMVLFEMRGGRTAGDITPFAVQVNLADLQPGRDSLLFGEVYEKLVPFGEKGAPLLDPLSAPSIESLVKEIESRDLQSIVDRKTQMMNAPALKEADEKTKQQ